MVLISLNAEAALTCANTGKTKVTIKTKTNKIKFNHKKRISQLTSIPTDTRSPYGNRVQTSTLGLTRADIKMVGAYQTKIHSKAGGRSCIEMEAITIHIILDPIIYIAKEHKKNTCRFKAIAAHEMNHVNISKKLIEEYNGKLKKMIRSYDKLYDKKKVFKTRNKKQKIAMVQKDYQNFISLIARNMNKELSKRNAAIDTAREYKRVNDMCPN